MFKLIPKDRLSYDWPVTVHVPAAGGAKEARTFTVTFRPVSTERYDELMDLRGASMQFATDEQITRGNTSVLREVIVGWGEDVCDEDGNAIPYSENVLEQLLAVPYTRVPLISAYLESVNGMAARKNSKAPRGT